MRPAPGSTGLAWASAATGTGLPAAVVPIDRLGGRLERAGLRALRSHPRLPDLAEVARAYARLLMSFTAAFWPEQAFEQSRAAAASIPADDRSLGAELARGVGLSHRDWVTADNARAMHQQQFRSLFEQVDVVLCPAMAVTAYRHDHSEPQHPQEAPFRCTPQWTPGAPQNETG